MAKTKPFEIRIKDADLLAILKTFKNMDDIAKVDLKKLSNDLAITAASAIGSSLQATPQGQAIAKTIRVSKTSRSPVIIIGESGKLSNATCNGALP